MRIDEIQEYLKEHNFDGWLLADFHGRNDIALELWQISSMLTRRAFYFIPAEGDPTALVNPVEADKFAGLPGKIIAYRGYAGLEKELERLLKRCERVAMEYSPRNGTIRSSGRRPARRRTRSECSPAQLTAWRATTSPAVVSMVTESAACDSRVARAPVSTSPSRCLSSSARRRQTAA